MDCVVSADVEEEDEANAVSCDREFEKQNHVKVWVHFMRFREKSEEFLKTVYRAPSQRAVFVEVTALSCDSVL